MLWLAEMQKEDVHADLLLLYLFHMTRKYMCIVFVYYALPARMLELEPYVRVQRQPGKSG